MSFGSSKWRTWVLDEGYAKPFFKAALEAGINFFDTADVYSVGKSERVTGAALKEYANRHGVVINTKVNGPVDDDANNRDLAQAHHGRHRPEPEAAGRRQLDLYQIHRFDYDTPMEETLEALNDVVRSGKARYIGASSMYAWQFMKMLDISKANGWTPFVSMQPQYNLVYREEEREMLPLCKAEGVGVIPWSPLARGFLAGGRAAPREGNTERARTDEFSPRLYYRDADFEVVGAVEAIAKARGCSNMQVALAWVLRNPAITAPIIGTTKAHHLDDAVGALKIEITDDEVKTLEAAYQPKPVLDHA